MANPVISSVSLNPDTVAPGETSEVTVNASDPDNQDITLDIVVTDSSGLTDTLSKVMKLRDPLTYEVTIQNDDGTKGTVTQGVDPNVFIYTAPN